MIAYMVIGGVMHETDVPDGALLLELGSTLNPAGGPDLPAIAWIDYKAGRFARDGQAGEPIPPLVVERADLQWRKAVRVLR